MTFSHSWKLSAAILAVSTLSISNALSQVVNDAIERMLEMPLNTTLTSNTTDCTVQWKCVNEKLTGKCIKYHNDQWFYFNVSDANHYYINVNQQDCRDIRGVQVVIIDGQPCEPSSYSILSCYSEGTRDDIFIRLPVLVPERTYLINVDGFLHDLCSFNITLSDSPVGLPAGEELNPLPLKTDGIEAIIPWRITQQQADELIAFEVWKKGKEDVKYYLVRQLENHLNAFGSGQEDYKIRDSIESSTDYKIIGIGRDHQRTLITQFHATLDRRGMEALEQRTLRIPVDPTKGSRYILRLYNAKDESLILTRNYQLDDLEKQMILLDIQSFIASGIFAFDVVVEYTSTGEKETHFYLKK